VSDTTEDQEDAIELDPEGIEKVRSQLVGGLEARGVQDPETLVREAEGRGELAVHGPPNAEPAVWVTLGMLYMTDIVLSLVGDEE
jgi:hypothetical protein